jgi:DNA polymerase III gamma/tau subunit
MKAASVAEIKGALKNKTIAQLTELCLRLARYKKDNKELLTYLLFEADDTISYVSSIKQEMDDNFEEINMGNLFWVKKSLRKILRHVNKYIKYTGDKQIEAEVRIYFCLKIKEAKIPMQKNTVLANLYKNQVLKIEAAMSSLHEDLQHDFEPDWEKVRRL